MDGPAQTQNSQSLPGARDRQFHLQETRDPAGKDTEAEGNQGKSRATETERNGLPSRQTTQSSQKTEQTSTTGEGPSTSRKKLGAGGTSGAALQKVERGK